MVCDYRETLSDLLIGRVDQIVRWGKQQGSGLRMQAHGSPANLLDMYAAAAIPETEVFGASIFDIPGFRRDPALIRPDRQSDLVNRFASSAAHVAGREVVISESFTWLRNHYQTALSHIKAESDKLLLNGINCIYYHGICFSPKETTWPGWLFYASTEANARNSIFRDVPDSERLHHALPKRASGRAATQRRAALLAGVRSVDERRHARTSVLPCIIREWIDETSCGQAGRWMIDNGYTFDFVSDRQLQEVACEDGRPAYVRFRRVSNGRGAGGQGHDGGHGAPACSSWPKPVRQFSFGKTLPQDVPGWKDHADRREST